MKDHLCLQRNREDYTNIEGKITFWIIRRAPIDSQLGNWSAKTTQIQPNSLNNVEDEEAQLDREIDETIAAMDEVEDSLKNSISLNDNDYLTTNLAQ